MPPEDESDDPDAFVPPLPAEDRLWRHPSELAATTPSATSAASRSTPRRGRAATLTAATLLVLALGAFATTRALGQDPTTLEAADATPREAAMAALGPAVARLSAERAGTPTSATAVVYRADGYLLTTEDAVADVIEPTIALSDGRTLPATIVGSDPVSGIAVVKVDATDLDVADLGGEGAVQAGAAALAVGHADSESVPSMGEGEITGTGWQLASEDRTRHDLIRAALGASTDASGALLCSETGTLLGLILPEEPGTALPPDPDPTIAAETPATATATDTATTVVRSDSGRARYAVPISRAVRVANELVTTGKAHYAWLGVTGQDVDDDASAPTGAQLTDITGGGPADGVRLTPGDVVIAIDELPVQSMSALASAIRDRRPGEIVDLAVVRGTETFTVTVTLTERP